jgi:hypothetical protein
MSLGRTVPLVIEPSNITLSPINGKERFELNIKLRLDKTDSLYQVGQQYFVGHEDQMGNIVAGDSIEYVNRNYFIFDDNNTEATFTIRITKGYNHVWYNVIFCGGKYPIGDTMHPYRYGKESFKTDNSVYLSVQYQLLELSQVKQNHTIQFLKHEP